MWFSSLFFRVFLQIQFMASPLPLTTSVAATIVTSPIVPGLESQRRLLLRFFVDLSLLCCHYPFLSYSFIFSYLLLGLHRELNFPLLNHTFCHRCSFPLTTLLELPLKCKTLARLQWPRANEKERDKKWETFEGKGEK